MNIPFKMAYGLYNVFFWGNMGVSKNNGTPKSSILIYLCIGFAIIKHPFGGFSPLFWETPIWCTVIFLGKTEKLLGYLPKGEVPSTNSSREFEDVTPQ